MKYLRKDSWKAIISLIILNFRYKNTELLKKSYDKHKDGFSTNNFSCEGFCIRKENNADLNSKDVRIIGDQYLKKYSEC